MLKRSGFKRPERVKPERPPLTPSQTPGRGVMRMADQGAEPVKKEMPARSETYRRWVASLPCWLCNIEGESQAAHADFGKGLSLKSSDATCFPLCGPHGSEAGCHYALGTAGTFTKEERRDIEVRAGEETIRELILKSQGVGKDAMKLRRALQHLGLVK